MSLNTQTFSVELQNGEWAAWEVTAENCTDEVVLLSLKDSCRSRDRDKAIEGACFFDCSEYGDFPLDNLGRGNLCKDGWPVQLLEVGEIKGILKPLKDLEDLNENDY